MARYLQSKLVRCENPWSIPRAKNRTLYSGFLTLRYELENPRFTANIDTFWMILGSSISGNDHHFPPYSYDIPTIFHTIIGSIDTVSVSYSGVPVYH